MSANGDVNYLRESGVALLLHRLAQRFVSEHQRSKAVPPGASASQWVAKAVAEGAYDCDVPTLRSLLDDAEAVHPELLWRFLSSVRAVTFSLSPTGATPELATLLPAAVCRVVERFGATETDLPARVAVAPPFGSYVRDVAEAIDALARFALGIEGPQDPETGVVPPPAPVPVHIDAVVELSEALLEPPHLAFDALRRFCDQINWTFNIAAHFRETFGVAATSGAWSYHVYAVAPACPAAEAAMHASAMFGVSQMIVENGLADRITIVPTDGVSTVPTLVKKLATAAMNAPAAPQPPVPMLAVFGHDFRHVHPALIGRAVTDILAAHGVALAQRQPLGGAAQPPPAASPRAGKRAPAMPTAAAAAAAPVTDGPPDRTGPVAALCVRRPRAACQGISMEEAAFNSLAVSWIEPFFAPADAGPLAEPFVFEAGTQPADYANPPIAVVPLVALHPEDLRAWTSSLAADAAPTPTGALCELVVAASRRHKVRALAVPVTVTSLAVVKDAGGRLGSLASTAVAAAATAPFKSVVEKTAATVAASERLAGPEWAAVVKRCTQQAPPPKAGDAYPVAVDPAALL